MEFKVATLEPHDLVLIEDALVSSKSTHFKRLFTK